MIKIEVAAPATDKGAISHLFDNLDLIISNKDKILSCNQYYHIVIPGCYVGGLYVGMYNLALGDILSLWDNTKWQTENRYYYNIIGSPLSGKNTAHWYNTETKNIESGAYLGNTLQFMVLARPALSLLNKNKEKRIKSKLSIYDLTKQLQR